MFSLPKVAYKIILFRNKNLPTESIQYLLKCFKMYLKHTENAR